MRFFRVVRRRVRRTVRDVRQYRAYKESARQFVHERLTYWNQFYSYPFNRVAIRDQSSRWGSCSTKRNLNFNYRIVLLPPELADYIIVHELCHLEEFNHSKQFWELVAKTIPDFRERRSLLTTVYSGMLKRGGIRYNRGVKKLTQVTNI